MHLLRISNIANYLTFERDLQNAIQFISLNVCPSGQLAQVLLARFNNDYSLVPVASFGLSEKSILEYQARSLQEMGDLMISLNSNELIINNGKSKSLDSPSSSLSEAVSEKWKCSIFMPLLPNFLITIATQISIPRTNPSLQYFNALRAVLNMYIQIMNTLEVNSRNRAGHLKNSQASQDLTERQHKILDLVKSGMTNQSIANHMGYSESLIRQETIAIYQKLGIEGRRELKANS